MTDTERYLAACHAMQTGVAIEMQITPKPTSPKHLRVGVNSALVANAAIARLLIAKGVFTLEEHEKAAADEMELEKIRYKMHLENQLGRPVELL